MGASLRPGGVLLLTLPNSLSTLRAHFGANWRGLEAPRHVSIPSQDQLMRLLETSGFSIQDLADDGVETAAESYRIERRGLALTRGDIVKAHKLEIRPIEKAGGNDFIKLVCEVRDNACCWRRRKPQQR